MNKQQVTDAPATPIPAAVRAADERANKLYEEAYSAPEQQPEQQGEQQEEQQGEPPAESQLSELKMDSGHVTSEGNIEPQAPTQEHPHDDAATWENRYKSMKGRFERAEKQNAQLAEQISSLQRVIATLEAKIQEPVAPQQPSVSRLITDEEEEEYGREFLDVVGKRAKEVVSSEVQELQAEIAALKNQLSKVGGVVTLSAKQQMDNLLNEQCPNWREINSNPDFLAWLKLPDTYSGAIRHDLLRKAYERNDGPRVLAFFNGFLAEEAAVVPSNSQPEPARSQKLPLEQYAAPGRARSAAASAPAEKPFITTAQITQFYSDVAAGRYRGREKEKEQMENAIFEAQRAGRIR